MESSPASLVHSVKNWFQRNWLVCLIPVLAFLLAAGVFRQLRWTFHGAKYQSWKENYSAAVQAGFEGQREQALQRMLQAAGAAPDDPAIHSELAMGFQQLGQKKQALTHLEKAVRLRFPNPENPDNHLGLAGAYIRAGEFEQAERILKEKILPRWPDSADAYYYHGLVLLETGEGEEAAERALRQLEECLKREGEHTQALYHAGVCQLRLNNPEEAAILFQKVITLKPSFARAYHELGAALRRSGKQQEAERVLKQFQELDSKERRVRHLETQHALDQLELPNLFELGRLYLDLQRYAEAERAFARFTFEAPTDPRGYQFLAEACRGLNKEREADRAEKLAQALDLAGGAQD
jgi:Flp pilus assembly protein TadD